MSVFYVRYDDSRILCVRDAAIHAFSHVYMFYYSCFHFLSYGCVVQITEIDSDVGVSSSSPFLRCEYVRLPLVVESVVGLPRLTIGLCYRLFPFFFLVFHFLILI